MAEKRHYQLISPGGQVAFFEGHGLAEIKKNVAEVFGVAPELVESVKLKPEAFQSALEGAKQKTTLNETTVKGLGKRWTENVEVDIVAGRSGEYNSGSLPPFNHIYD